MERNKYEELFNKKIDRLADHDRYERLDAQRKSAIKLHTGYGHDAIAASDFMDRIIAMPEEYIRNWLDGKNALEWTKEFELRLKAAEYGYLDVFDADPNVRYEVIPTSQLNTFEKFGWKKVRELSTNILVKSG